MVFAEACLLTETVLQAGNSAIAATTANKVRGLLLFLFSGDGIPLAGSANIIDYSSNNDQQGIINK